ncbi:hypothetical protein FRB94_003029 [Tulasnella sp. JGI-2019a]|nr:hypothetical protein FRB94_003029 [Tulasnella sp. JGI-2019a]
MVGIADLGVGLASGAVVEVTKAILDIAKEIRANKKSVNALAEYCDETTKYLDDLVKEAYRLGTLTADVDKILTGYMKDYKKTLQDIQQDMTKWKAFNPKSKIWKRIYHKSDIEKSIASAHEKVKEKSDRFNKQISTLCVAVGDKAIRATYSLDAHLAQAHAEDQKDFATLLTTAADGMIMLNRTDQGLAYNIVQTGKLHEKMDYMERKLEYTNDELRNKLGEETDPVVIAAAYRLKEALREYGGTYPPESLDIDSDEVVMYHRSSYSGSRSNIFKGSYKGHVVAIKQLKLELRYADPSSEQEILGNVYRRIKHEADVWSRLQHPNVVTFIGCWKANKGELTCLVSLVGTAEGLRYLHSRPEPIIHANLQGKHILVDAPGNPLLTDFGISVLADEIYTGSRPPDTKWTAPEILDARVLDASTASDVWSFGMVILELFTARDPFHEQRKQIRNPNLMSHRIMEGLRPEFPADSGCSAYGLTTQDCPLWCLMLRCWASNPNDRPSMDEVCKELKAIYQN